MLLVTLKTANRACNYVSAQAWDHKKFGRVPLHKLTYYSVREQFGLSAQMAVRCIGKVKEAYTVGKRCKRSIKLTAAFPYDDRILSWQIAQQTISIWTLAGRQAIPFVCGQRQRELLQTRQGESNLAFIDGDFYLFATCEVEEPEPIEVEGVLGVDLGIVNIASTSDGEHFSGSRANNIRHRRSALRTKLQARGTHSAKRKLARLSGKERRFATDINHVISKQLVHIAQRTKRAIGLEDLTGIRSRVRARRRQRYQLHSWSFYQLRQFVEYKAKLAGIPIVPVDPAYTSQTCPGCGHADKRNRRTQSLFRCVNCEFVAHADTVGAINIGRAAVAQPSRPDFVNLPNVPNSKPGFQSGVRKPTQFHDPVHL